MKALGLIETMGLLAAIEAADAMLKAADVQLLERTFVGSGLVTVSVEGEVSAVQASIDAGVAAVKRICSERLVSEHVIPRPDATLDGIILLSREKEIQEMEVSCRQIESKTQSASSDSVASSSSVEKKSQQKVQKQDLEQTMLKIKKMTLSKLREFARSCDAFPFTTEQIGKKGKKELLEALEIYHRKLSDE